MIKPIVKDIEFLSRRSENACEEDQEIAVDLLDTITAHKETCIGMAANMIGYLKRIIVVKDKNSYLVLYNPVILKVSGKRYETEEGCLCHAAAKKAVRYESIKTAYLNEDFQKRIKTFHHITAQIIQHEIDHCDGILI